MGGSGKGGVVGEWWWEGPKCRSGEMWGNSPAAALRFASGLVRPRLPPIDYPYWLVLVCKQACKPLTKLYTVLPHLSPRPSLFWPRLLLVVRGIVRILVRFALKPL